MQTAKGLTVQLCNTVNSPLTRVDRHRLSAQVRSCVRSQHTWQLQDLWGDGKGLEISDKHRGRCQPVRGRPPRGKRRQFPQYPQYFRDNREKLYIRRREGYPYPKVHFLRQYPSQDKHRCGKGFQDRSRKRQDQGEHSRKRMPCERCVRQGLYGFYLLTRVPA